MGTAKALRITSRHLHGSWRCGLYHPPHPVVHHPDTFTAKEVGKLKADIFLTVEEVDWKAAKLAASQAVPKGRSGKGKRPARKTAAR